MKTEKEKMLAGELYDASDAQLTEERYQARMLFQKINAIQESEKEQRDQLFYELFGEAGPGLYIEPPFFCDYGYNIKVGEKVFMNYNCCILYVMRSLWEVMCYWLPGSRSIRLPTPLSQKSERSG